MAIIVTDEAIERIRDIIENLAVASPSGAEHVFAAFSRCIDQLDHFPQMWPRAGIHTQMRKRLVTEYPAYSIYFRIIGEDVVVALVHDGRQEHSPFQRP